MPLELKTISDLECVVSYWRRSKRIDVGEEERRCELPGALVMRIYEIYLC